MTISIVSQLPQAPPVVATETASQSADPGDLASESPDFESLLLAQLQPVVSDKLPNADTPAVLPDDDAAPADTAALFAALGIGVSEAARAPSETSKAADTRGSPAIAAQPVAAQPVAAQPVAAQPVAADDARGERAVGAAASAAAAIVDDKPAKLAGPARAADPLPVKSELSEAPASPLAVQAANRNHPLAGPAAVTDSRSTLALASPLRSQNWTSDFGQKVVWLATNDKQIAQLTLNPQHMGPIEISVNVEKGNATASFVSANAEVRDAIETALPRLREMFASAGIELGQTNVSAESFQQQAQNGEGNGNTSRWSADDAILTADPATSSNHEFGARRGSGMVDIFA